MNNSQEVIMINISAGRTYKQLYQAISENLPLEWKTSVCDDMLIVKQENKLYYYVVSCACQSASVQVRSDDDKCIELFIKNMQDCNELLHNFVHLIIEPTCKNNPDLFSYKIDTY